MTYQRKPHQSAIGPMSAKSEHLAHYIPPRVAFDIPARITNAGSRGSYSQQADWANSAQRPGAMDAYFLPSLSFEGLKYPSRIVGQERATAESASSEVSVGNA